MEPVHHDGHLYPNDLQSAPPGSEDVSMDTSVHSGAQSTTGPVRPKHAKKGRLVMDAVSVPTLAQVLDNEAKRERILNVSHIDLLVLQILRLISHPCPVPVESHSESLYLHFLYWVNSDLRRIQVASTASSNDSSDPPRVRIKRELPDSVDLGATTSAGEPSTSRLNKKQRRNTSPPIEILDDQEFYKRENVKWSTSWQGCD